MVPALARNVYTYENMVSGSQMHWNRQDRSRAGRLGRHHTEKNTSLRKKFGFSFEDIALPKRFLKLPPPQESSKKTGSGKR
jgi:aldehyde:ferredoxin oxidoreductase